MGNEPEDFRFTVVALACVMVFALVLDAAYE